MNKFRIPGLYQDERYAGVMLTADDALSHHLILLPGEIADVTWDEAMAWATRIGGVLPDRGEQALLFSNLKHRFKPKWYWSGEQYLPYPSASWFQFFDHGSQSHLSKDYKGYARAIRRVKITEVEHAEPIIPY